jgi:hypothetical protein
MRSNKWQAGTLKCAALLQAPVFDADGAVVESQDEEVGSGLVLLSTRQGRLIMALVPAVDEADPEAELAACSTQYEIELLEDERVLQVRFPTA